MIRWRRIGLRCLVSSVVLSCVALSGCIPQRVNLDQTGGASLQVEAPARIHLAARVYVEADRLVLYGTAWTHAKARRPISGHVEVEIRGSDRTLLATQHVHYEEDFQTQKRFRRATFQGTFPVVPLSGSFIILRHHDSTPEEMTDEDDHGNDKGP